MQCAACGKTGFVTIGDKRFCSNCGETFQADAPTPPSQPVEPIASPEPAPAAAVVEPTPKPAPSMPAAAPAEPVMRSSANMLDLRKNALTPSKGTARIIKTATDLRPKAAPRPAPLATAPQITEPTPLPQPLPEPLAPVNTATPVESPPEPPVAPEPEPAQPTPVLKPTQAPELPPAVTNPEPQVAPAAVAPEPAVMPSVAPKAPAANRSPLLTKIPQHPAIATEPTPPQATLSQIDAMKVQAATAPEPPKPPQSPALQQALKAAKQSTATSSVVKIGAGVAAIAIMASVIWVQNSPKLAFHNAASKAGVAASLPTYVPSSYHQQGSAQATPGQLTLNFTSPSSSEPLTITQRRSDWDSNSLKQNYVAQQSTDALAVAGQGLTIYLYGDKASWINHGVWYEISGTTKISHEQVLKIAYGL